MIYNIIPFIQFVEPIELISDIEIMNNYIRDLEIRICDLKIFGDCDINGYDSTEFIDNETVYYDDELSDTDSENSGTSRPQSVVNKIYWIVDIDGKIRYQKPDINTSDYYPLSTLQFILDKFKADGRIASGYVVAYNQSVNEDFESYQSLYYKVENSKLIYHINKTLELTKHWNNIIKYKNGDIITDIYPFNNSEFYIDNSFVNFLFNTIFLSIQEINVMTDNEIFEATYIYVD